MLEQNLGVFFAFRLAQLDFFTIQNREICRVPCVPVSFQGPVPTEIDKSAYLDRHTTNQRNEGAPIGCILQI